jgi:hypothetical protein
LPDRFERDARESSETLVIGGIVNEKGLERREEQTGSVADAGNRLADLAQRAAELL